MNIKNYKIKVIPVNDDSPFPELNFSTSIDIDSFNRSEIIDSEIFAMWKDYSEDEGEIWENMYYTFEEIS